MSNVRPYIRTSVPPYTTSYSRAKSLALRLAQYIRLAHANPPPPPDRLRTLAAALIKTLRKRARRDHNTTPPAVRQHLTNARIAAIRGRSKVFIQEIFAALCAMEGRGGA